MRFGPGPASATHPDSLVPSDGILLRAVFDAIEMMRAAKWSLEVSPVRDTYLLVMQYSQMRLSCCQIYNESVTDLLADDGGRNNVLPVRFRRDLGAFAVRGLTEASCDEAREVVAKLRKALAKRHCHATRVNNQSSRSHCLITMHFCSRKHGIRRSFTYLSHLCLHSLKWTDAENSRLSIWQAARD